MRLGVEAAGVVTAAGPDAVGPAGPVAVGDEVIAFRASGAYAAELVVRLRRWSRSQPCWTGRRPAGLMLTGVTAWHTLAATGVSEGDTVLIHAATGGVGVMAVQLAAARGAMVVATASPARHELLRELGAVPVAYGDGLADRVRAAAPGGIDAALDLIGTDEAVDVSLALALTGRASPRSPRSRAGRRKASRFSAAPRRGPGHRDPCRRAPGTGPAGPGQDAAGLRHPDLPAGRRGGRSPRDHDRSHHRQDRADPLTPVTAARLPELVPPPWKGA